MPAPRTLALILLAIIGMAGCDSRHETGQDAGVAAANSATPTAPDTVDANVSMRYACQASTSVVLLHDGGARVSLPDGSRVDLERVVGSKPAVFAGSSLYFTTGERDAHLSQQDGGNELACKPG